MSIQASSRQWLRHFFDTCQRSPAPGFFGKFCQKLGSHERHELDLPGLRSWALKRYPYLAFYIEREDHIDVWRMLYGMRDIPT